jgi:chromosome partitioning protein
MKPTTLNKLTMIIAFLNNKGGVGKTTGTLNLGAALAGMGKSVIIIDADQQMNSTNHLVPHLVSPNAVTLTQLLINPTTDISDCIVETKVENLMMIMADRNIEKSLEAYKNNYARPSEILKAKLEILQGEVDYIIIDCPPNLGLTVENALAASTHFITPIDDSAYAEAGLIPLEDTMLKKIYQINPTLQCLGVLPVMMRKGTALDLNIAEKTTFGNTNMPRMAVTIPFRQQVRNYTHTGELCVTPKARTDIARAFRALAKIVVQSNVATQQSGELA